MYSNVAIEVIHVPRSEPSKKGLALACSWMRLCSGGSSKHVGFEGEKKVVLLSGQASDSDIPWGYAGLICCKWYSAYEHLISKCRLVPD